jgi:glucose-6-phosphate isomerase
MSFSSLNPERSRSYGTNTSWMTASDSNINHHYSSGGDNDLHHHRKLCQQLQRQLRYFPKCTEVPQFDALLNAAAEFHYEEKLHLRHLCNDTARCSGLTAVHVSAWSAATIPSSFLVAAEQDEEIVFQHNGTGSSSARNTNSSSNNSNSSSSNPNYEEIEDDHLGGASEHQMLLQRFGNRSKIVLDYSRQQVTGETMELLFDLADAVEFTERREAFRTGERINVTENKPVLHHLLRMPKGYDFPPVTLSRYVNSNPQSTGSLAEAGNTNTPSSSQHTSVYDVLEEIHDVRDKIEDFSRKIRSQDHSIGLRGVTGKRITDTVVVSSSGGMHLGTKFVHQALSADKRAAKAAEGRRLHFVSNVDPVDAYFTTRNLDPERTMIVVVSKGFSSATELSNFRIIRHWLNTKLQSNPNGTVAKEPEITKHHIVAVTSRATTDCLGIPESNVFRIWDWIIGRFSVCSAIGILPLSLHYSYEIVSEFLAGAHDMDEHFFNAPLRDNIPVLLGLLGVWNSTFMGYSTRALIPYSEALRGMSKYVQLVDMESNGKRVAVDGTELLHQAGEINLGEPGCGMTNHPFFQLMHQGRVIPADFIGFMESPQPQELQGEAVSSHDELMCNFFGQPDSLAYGKELMDLVQEGVPDGLREHMVFSGNRPSSSILMTRLDPFSVGQLVALYEHRTAVQGFLWGINSFDQHGIQLGCTMSSRIRHQLAVSRRTGATVQGFNQSTSSLLEVYLAHGK